MAKLAPDLSPYRYAFNNPISFTDPDGMYEDSYGGGDEYDDMEGYRDSLSIGYGSCSCGTIWEKLGSLEIENNGSRYVGGDDDGHWVGSNGQLLYDDGIDDGKLYYAENDNIKNAVLVAENGNVKDQYALGDMINAMAQSLGMPTNEDFAFTLNVDYKASGASTFIVKNKEDMIDWTGLAKIYRDENTKFNLTVDLSKTNNEPIKTYYNLLNTLEHENYHYEDSLKLPSLQNAKWVNPAAYGKQSETNAVNYQKKQSSWGKTTSSFQKAVNEYVKTRF